MHLTSPQQACYTTWRGDVNTASLGKWPPRCRLLAKPDEVPTGTKWLHVQNQGEPPRWRTLAVVWHGEGWAPPCSIAQDTLHEDDNHISIHTSLVVARNKDHIFCCWPSGWRWKVCDWWTKISTCQKQYHYWCLEREITESSRNVEELTHEMKRYRWNIIGLCEVHWKNFGKMSTTGHKLYFSGSEDRHEHGVEFLVHKDTVNAIMGCQPVSSQLITIRLKTSPFNITVI